MSLIGWLWQIRYKYEDYYFKQRYANREAKIYYDKKIKQYVNPKILQERSSSLIYVCSEIARDSLYYGYSIHNKHHHAHTIDEVFEDAYNYSETFAIEDEEAFSKQELRLIYKLIRKGIEDRKVGVKNGVRDRQRK